MSEPSTEMPLGARLQRLQRIVTDLDRDDIELEDALRLFEEGVAHLRAAGALIEQTELQIDRLLDEKGRIRLEPVDEPK